MMTGYYSIRDFDWTLLGLTAIISTLGLLEIYSATRSTVWVDAHLKQMVWLAAGVVLLWLLSVVEARCTRGVWRSIWAFQRCSCRLHPGFIPLWDC